MTRILIAFALAATATATAEARCPPPQLGAPALPPRPPQPPTNGWSATAVGHRGQLGQVVTITCPAGGRIGSIWGSGTYTDDSSVCTAGVHAGFITVARGGRVLISIRGGQQSYPASSRNGIKSQSWGKWHGSFVVLGGTPGPQQQAGPRRLRWTDNATGLRGQNRSRHSFTCPPQGRPSVVWGSGRYTDDSSICTAAVHAGLIGFASGGVVTIEIEPGAQSYPGSTHNGVTTQRWGRWSGSFAFVP